MRFYLCSWEIKYKLEYLSQGDGRGSGNLLSTLPGDIVSFTGPRQAELTLWLHLL